MSKHPKTNPDDQAVAGLTLRQYFASATFQGLLANSERCSLESAADEAVKQADTLIAALNKEP